MIYTEEDMKFWEDLYVSGDVTWDLGGTTPIFKEISKNIIPGKICIIGCGKGHDAVMFAKKNFEVTAIDFAPSAISCLDKIAADAKVNIDAINSNIFNLSNDYYNQFNYVIEQTCFCAINPNMRNNYEQLVSNLLVKGGDYQLDQVVGREYAEEVRVLDFVDGFSSSQIIQKLKQDI